jgi:thioredoxin 2
MTIVRCARCGTKNRVDERAALEQKPVCGKCGAALDLSKTADGPDTSKPRVVTDATLETEIQAGGALPLLLDCWAPWCGPCRLITPVLEQLAAESDGRYIIGKLNVDENPRTSARFNIQSIPSLLIFKNGSLVETLVGVQPKQVIAAALARHGQGR